MGGSEHQLPPLETAFVFFVQEIPFQSYELIMIMIIIIQPYL